MGVLVLLLHPLTTGTMLSMLVPVHGTTDASPPPEQDNDDDDEATGNSCKQRRKSKPIVEPNLNSKSWTLVRIVLTYARTATADGCVYAVHVLIIIITLILFGMRFRNIQHVGASVATGGVGCVETGGVDRIEAGGVGVVEAGGVGVVEVGCIDLMS